MVRKAKGATPKKPRKKTVKKPECPLFPRAGDVLGFDPGTSNCGQAYVDSIRGIAKPRVHKFSKGKKSTLTNILEEIYKKLNRDRQVQACVARAQATKGEHPHIVIENQEGVSFGKGKFALALRMIRMNAVAGAIAMYFRDRGFKHVRLLAKSQKWILASAAAKTKGRSSKVLKKLYKESSLHVMKNTNSKTALQWLKKHPKKAQHVHDAVVMAMYELQE